MKKNHLLAIVFIALCNFIGFTQCINTSPFGAATENSCSSGTISTCNYASEYGEITFNVTGGYIFNSSIPTDYLTLTTAANVVIAFGQAPLTATVPTTGIYRLHVNTNSSCGTQATCRVTTYACSASTSSVGCINTTPFGSAIISSCTSGTITNCNWAQEYSDLTFNTTGNYTFSSSITTDYLTFTTAGNVVLAFGPQPLSVNIPSIGGYRLHVSNNSACGTDNNCRTTSYACSFPCVGLPSAGTTQSNYVTLCSPATVNFYLTGASAATGLTYQWQTSPNATTWTNALSATSSVYSQIVNTTGYFRCIVACGSFTAASAPKLITIGGIPIAGTTLSSGPPPCGGGNVTYNLSSTSANYGVLYQWQSSPNSTSWTDLAGKTFSTTTELVTVAAYYRCVLSCGTNTAASTPFLTTVFGGVTSYATPPYYQTFDSPWQNGCAVRDVPDNLYWKNTPENGDNSWRQQSDGLSAFWGNPSIGVVVPASGTGCADFHSSWAPNNSKGEMSFYVDMSQNGKYALSFYYLNGSGTDKLDVMLSTDGGISYSIKGAYTTQTAWTKKTIYFNKPNSATCVLKFRGTADNGNDDIGIDSLSLKLICLNPTITASASSTTLCAGQTLTLTATGAANYTWTPGGFVTSSVVVTPTVNTHYILTGTNDGLCLPTVDVLVYVIACSGIDELYGSLVSLYPNPTEGAITISLPSLNTATSFEIVDSFGKIVHKEDLKQEKTQINIQGLANGLYFYKVLQSGANIGIGKLVKH